MFMYRFVYQKHTYMFLLTMASFYMHALILRALRIKSSFGFKIMRLLYVCIIFVSIGYYKEVINILLFMIKIS